MKEGQEGQEVLLCCGVIGRYDVQYSTVLEGLD
jgi:hypothetical protein